MSRAQLTSTVEQNTGGAVSPYVAGKNAVINGGMDIWQRGTSVSLASGTGYTACFYADRFQLGGIGANAAATISRQVTGDTANLPNIQYCSRIQRNSGQTGTSAYYGGQTIETANALPLAGKTVTYSFYARAGANYSATSNALGVLLESGTGIDQNINGTWTNYTAVISSTATLTTTWQRFTFTGTIAATATELSARLIFTPTGTAGVNDYYEVTGVQLEVGSVATPFSRAGGTLSGELTACQRYYYRWVSGAGAYGQAAYVTSGGSTSAWGFLPAPVTMRTAPTSTTDFSSLLLVNYPGGTSATITAVAAYQAGPSSLGFVTTVASAYGTAGQVLQVIGNNSNNAYIGFSAEL